MRHLFLMVAFSILPFSLSAAESADELFEQAMVAFSEATQAESAGSLEAYHSVRKILDRIVDDFPTSDLAVSILLEDTIDGMDVAALNNYLSEQALNLPSKLAEPNDAAFDPVGPVPPLAYDEQASLRQIQACWNVGALSAAAQKSSIVVKLELEPSGQILPGSIGIASFEGDEITAQEIFDSARRAILRCGQDGFSLPPEKFVHWKNVELRFDPSELVSGTSSQTSIEARGCAPLEKEYVGNLNYVLLTFVSTDHTGLAKNYYLDTHDTYEILANEMKDIEHYLGGYTSFELSDGTCLGYLTNPKSKANIYLRPDGIRVQYILPDRPQIIDIPIGFILDRDRLRGANLGLSESLDQANVEEGRSDVAIPQLKVPTRTEKEIVLDVQTELNRIGCAAGTADGVAGRRTRAAFSNFISDSGLVLSEGDLATEEAIAVLKAQEGTVCKVRTMASTPASALTGSWGFRSDCPGFGNRIIRNTGSMNLTYRGDNTLRGPSRNKQGNTGSAVIQFQGGRTATTLIQFGFVTLRGNLTRSTTNMTVSGTGSHRCKIVAWKN